MATDTRMDVEYIVSEYGCVNLHGKSTRERAQALISVCHPNWRRAYGLREICSFDLDSGSPAKRDAKENNRNLTTLEEHL